jgi:hypothetical protein
MLEQREVDDVAAGKGLFHLLDDAVPGIGFGCGLTAPVLQALMLFGLSVSRIRPRDV